MKKDKEVKEHSPVEYETHKKSLVQGILISIAASLVVGGGIGGLIVYSQYKQYDDPNIKKLVDAYNIMVDDYFFGDADIKENVTDAAITGMTTEGDHYTIYTPTFEDQHLDTTQIGLGFRYMYYGGNAYVNYIYEQAPCILAGLDEGDIITHSFVNNEWVELNTLSYHDAVMAIENIESDKLKYKVIDHQTHAEEEVTYDRNYFNYAGCKILGSKVVDNKLVATIKVDTFLDTSLAFKVKSALTSIENEYGKKIDTLNIDLRGNGGGYVSQAVNLAGLFVPKGTIILQYLYKDGHLEDYKTSTNPTFAYISKFNIIQDRNSASASETFTLAMKYLKDTTIVGQTSYGKGIVQALYHFDDNSVLRYTVAKSQYPVNNNEAVCIHKVGINPTKGYDLSNCFYYYGELNYDNYNEAEILEIKARIVEQINTLLNTSFSDFTTAMKDFQTKNSLEVTGDINLESGKLLQKMLYDYYLTFINNVCNL